MSNVDRYTAVTDAIIADLEKGVRPWTKPWNAGQSFAGLPLRSNGIPYRGINVLILWLESINKNYSNPRWMTYKQAQEFNGQVRKGEKSTAVFYASRFNVTEDNGDEKSIFFMKSYNVFNVQQIDGLPEKFQNIQKPKDITVNNNIAIEHAEQFFNNCNAKIKHGGDSAFYAPSSDVIVLPEIQHFNSSEHYTATKAHEFIHWTGHDSRLDRNLHSTHHDRGGYAREELVAELGSAFVCAYLNIAPTVREDHAQYIASWLEVLKDDKKAIFQASQMAQKALDYLLKQQPDYKEQSEDME